MRWTNRGIVAILLVGLAAIVCVQPASALVMYVDGTRPNDSGDGLTWATAKRTIQAAINSTTLMQCPEIRVRGASGTFNGVYYGPITMRSGVSLYGRFGGWETTRPTLPSRPPIAGDLYETIIDAQNLGCAVTVPETQYASVVVDGFTIRNGNATSGGGISIANPNPSFGASLVTITHNCIQNNTATTGGGISSTSTILNVRYNLIRYNTGGGANCVFDLAASPSANSVIADNIITQNSVPALPPIPPPPTAGVAGVHTMGNYIIWSNLITQNTGGPAILCAAPTAGTCTPAIVNNTIANNPVAPGGCVALQNNVIATVRNNIIAYNGQGIVKTGTGTTTLNKNDFYGNVLANYTGVTPGVDDFYLNPNFVSYMTGNYHLATGSPCINFGAAYYAGYTPGGSLSYDIDGEMRVYPTISPVDVGSDEYGVPATPPTTPVVVDDGDYTQTTASLHAYWSSSHSTGVDRYEYAIGTSPTDPGSGYVVPWTPSTINNVTHSGLSLQRITTYYWYVKARSCAGAWSAVGVSNGITVGPASLQAVITPRDFEIDNCTDIQEITVACTYDGGIPVPAGTSVTLHTNGTVVFTETGTNQVVVTTDSQGVAHAQVTHNASHATGSDTIQATAQWLGATGFDSTGVTVVPAVTSLQLSIDPRNFTVHNCSDVRDITVTCTHGGGTPVPEGVDIQLSTSGIAVFYPDMTNQLTVTTDGNGIGHAQVTNNEDRDLGTDTLQASMQWRCATASDSTYVTVQEYQPSATLTVNPPSITGPANCDVTLTVNNYDYTPIAGVSATISTSAGTFQGKTNPFTAETAADGTITAVLVLDPAQDATISATYDHECLTPETIEASVIFRQPVWQNVGVDRSSILVADLVAGGAPEVGVVDTTGQAHIWDAQGNQRFLSPASFGYNTLSAADLDGRAGLELVAPSGPGSGVTAFGYDPATSSFEIIGGWPAATPYPFAGVSAALGDANLDGSNEIIAGDDSCIVLCWNSTGDATIQNGWSGSLWLQVAGSDISYSSVALGDINPEQEPNDIPDAVVGALVWQGINPWAFSGDEWHDYNWTCLFSDGWSYFIAASACYCSPVIGDMDGDGANDVAIGDTGGWMWIHLTSDTQYWRSYQMPDAYDIQSSPAIAHIDGTTCLVFGSNGGRVYMIRPDGTDMPGWAGGILLAQPEMTYPVVPTPLVGMVIAGSNEPQIIAGCADGNVYALWADGANHAGGPVAKRWLCAQDDNMPVLSTPAFCSLDGEHLDLIVGSTDGVYKIHFDGTNSNDDIVFDPDDWDLWQWRTFHYDNARTGCTTPPATTMVASSIFGRVNSSQGYWLEGTEAGQVTVQYWNGANWVDETRVHVQGRATAIWETRYLPLLTAGNGTSGDEYNEGAFVVSQLIPGETYRLVISAPNHTAQTFSVNGGNPIPAGRTDVGDLTLTHL